MQNHAGDAWHDLATIIPPAPESLAHMAAELEHREPASSPATGPRENECAVGQIEAPTSVGLYRVQSKASVRFGEHAAPKRGSKAPAPAPEPVGEDVVEQLSLF